MLHTNKEIASAYALTILRMLNENPDNETTNCVKETVDFLVGNYCVDPKNGYSTEDTLLTNLISLQAAIQRTISMNEVLDLKDEYLVSILKRF